ncbi:MAG: MltA domain-containing protein, partial [Rhizobiaceae bacterium]|nr:MltA domain-containing protein [Rhizobiaceae bacterium]
MSGKLEGIRLAPVSFDEIPRWREDDPSPLFAGLKECGRYVRSVKPYRKGSLGLGCDDLMPLLDGVEKAAIQTSELARQFFETRCQPFRIERSDGKPGLVTAFYEPEVGVSSKRDDEYLYPFYRRPSDLIDIDEGNRPANMDPSYRFGLLR